MIYRGTVKNGVVALEGPEIPAEGTVVRVGEIPAAEDHPPWAEVFNDLIGAADELPEVLAENHNHYIHGTPKK